MFSAEIDPRFCRSQWTRATTWAAPRSMRLVHKRVIYLIKTNWLENIYNTVGVNRWIIPWPICRKIDSVRYKYNESHYVLCQRKDSTQHKQLYPGQKYYDQYALLYANDRALSKTDVSHGSAKSIANKTRWQTQTPSSFPGDQVLYILWKAPSWTSEGLQRLRETLPYVKEV